ncbi:hypothetical protein A3A64_01760 [Candidatus Gottesmanbacteria bacterium RIFCSPLOWO2_01_FULL_48_11]|uniref:Glycosyl hydrolases family 39 N-terminal catalytic domain-containing protein n=1 Tax=Candidatus Gottesmanbacteria bacterium RIFCSPLOWO2_01_FULL_48_11 TaxID=1798395 RepID=A0A1F6ASS2_9BACT|nr:MAG: hypothetical protein A3A64_01760 [Candidatus Gottesmanbacteria bacterium RIFCSPLOWO2_01_FULL_48_11]
MTLLERNASPKVTSIITYIALIVFLPLLILATYQTVSLISRASGTPANIVVDTKATIGTVTTDFYHAYAQGGEEANDMLAPILPELKGLKPKLIRLDHIYDHYGDVVTRSGDGSLSFNFSQLDAAVDTILASGAKPQFALSFMPPAIAQGGSLINPPNNWDDWAQVVQRTIEHYSGKGEKNLTGIYYEAWNEPDLAQFGSWKYSGEKNYLTLYKYSSIGAKNAQNTNRFYLGGPSTTGLYKSWIIALINSGNRVDFLSWHSYLPDPKQFDRDQRNLISWLLPYPGYTLIPTLITEYGFTGAKDKRYGTMFAAAHTAAVIRQLIQSNPDYAFSFQPKDGPGQEDGSGWGFVTHETNGKKKKPRYHVFTFLDDMAGTRLNVTGEGTWVTSFATTRDNVIRVLLVNFDKSGSHTENVPVSFTNLTPGSYNYRERFLLGRDATLKETVSGNSLTKQVFMSAQSVAILELTKQ